MFNISETKSNIKVNISAFCQSIQITCITNFRKLDVSREGQIMDSLSQGVTEKSLKTQDFENRNLGCKSSKTGNKPTF